MNSDRELWIGCHCGDLTHVARLNEYDWGDNNKEIYLSLYFATHLGLWNRICVGLKYIFMGQNSKHEYYEIILDSKTKKDIVSFLNEKTNTTDDY